MLALRSPDQHLVGLLYVNETLLGLVIASVLVWMRPGAAQSMFLTSSVQACSRVAATGAYLRTSLRYARLISFSSAPGGRPSVL